MGTDIKNFEQFIKDVNSLNTKNESADLNQIQDKIFLKITKSSKPKSKLSFVLNFKTLAFLSLVVFVLAIAPIISLQLKRKAQLEIIDSALSSIDGHLSNLDSFNKDFNDSTIIQISEEY